MGRNLPFRTIRSGPYMPSTPYTGNEGDAIIFRKNNLITRGKDGRFYEENYAGEGDLSEDLALGPLTGTITITEDSTNVMGTGTLFKTETRPGQRILILSGTDSWLVVPQRIVSDTEMVVWRAPDGSASGVRGFRMPRLFTIETQRGSSWWGNARRLDRGSIVGVGDGSLLVNGQPLIDDLPLTRNSKIALYDPLTDTYSVFTLGMDTPVAPTLAAVGGGTKGMSAGNYSLVITPARKQTAGWNNPSLRADVTITANQRVEITFPAMDTANGQNSWRVWVTPYSFTQGSDLNYLNGPWHYWIEVTDTDVSPAGGTFTTEWLDAEVEFNETVSFDNDPPVEAEFVELLDFKLVYISCQGQGFATHPEATSPGPFIVPTKPNNIEAAPLTLAFSTSPPESIIGAVSAQGRLYLLTPNHLQIAMATGNDITPIVIRPYWRDGFACPEQLVFVNGMLYGYTMGGPSRSTGEGDEMYAQRDWAADVRAITKFWNPGHVLMGYDPDTNLLLCYHIADHRNAAGFWTTRVLGYSLELGFWAFDRLMTSDEQDMIVSGLATVNNHLELVVGGRGFAQTDTFYRLTEDGFRRITEDFDFRVLE